MNTLRLLALGALMMMSIRIFDTGAGQTAQAQPPGTCGYGLPARLIPSEAGRVTAEQGLTLYEMPYYDAEQIAQVETETPFTAWYGPSCTDDAVWWLVDANDTFGWLMESTARFDGNGNGAAGTYFVEPLGRSVQDILSERPHAGDQPFPQEFLDVEFLLSANVSTAATARWVLPGEMENRSVLNYENPLFREILLPGYVGTRKQYWLFVRVYRTEAWEAAVWPLDDLRAQLDERPDAPYLTGLPRINAGQMFEAATRYLEFRNGSGMRGLAQYSQFGEPPGDGEVWYLFSGLTQDREYLVHAAFPLDSDMLPDSDVIFETFNYEAWPDWPRDDRLFKDSLVMMLEAAPDALTTPRLSDLDALIESLFVDDPLMCAEMPSRLSVGDTAVQALETDPLRVRESPNGATMESLYPGETVIIAEGPECVDGMVWWQVLRLDQWVGWVAEVQGETYYLEPHVPEVD